jgi:biotin carboxyl carrier protein
MKIKVEINGQAFNVDVEDIHARPVIAVVDGERYEVWPTSEEPQIGPTDESERPSIAVPEAPFQTTGTAGSGPSVSDHQLTAPLPGVIVAILVKPGENVSRGQELCTLEAMKMKNAIRANHDGLIDSVEVNVGDQVSHGQVLMTFVN